MKKIKLPRKRKKIFKKDNGSMGYMSAVVVAEMIIEDPTGFNLIANPRKFYNKILTHPNGQLKKVISYY